MFKRALIRILVMAALIVLAVAPASSDSYRRLHSFKANMANPASGLILDAAGNAYGTTLKGGLNNAGMVYELSPTTGYHVIYEFKGGDGRFPQGNLVFDSDGNLYGATIEGGAYRLYGAVFKLTPPENGNGLWTETTVYSFMGGQDGASPQAGVVMDSRGNLYGTALNGGRGGLGVVFQLTPTEDGQWTQNTLYSFSGGSDGGSPMSGLVLDDVGNIFGTTELFGVSNGGTAFELSAGGGQWTYAVLHAFDSSGGGKDGFRSVAGLLIDSAGNLYGTTSAGGAFGLGTVFELTSELGNWNENILYSFAGGKDGIAPSASLAFDPAENLYGTTIAGGAVGTACGGNGCGTVFKLTQGPNGEWTESHFSLSQTGASGVFPMTPVVLDKEGNVYGTTTAGGYYGNGVVFEITPNVRSQNHQSVRLGH